jgi:hypothetical protein
MGHLWARISSKNAPASKRRASGGFFDNRGLLFTYAGFVKVQVPEQCIQAVAVFAGQQIRTRSEKAVRSVTFDINTAALGVYPSLPLMNIMAGWTGKIPRRYRFAVTMVKKREETHLAFRISTCVADDFV